MALHAMHLERRFAAAFGGTQQLRIARQLVDRQLRQRQPDRRLTRRFGSEFGRFFANPGVSWDARALPYDRTKLPYAVYVVQQPVVVETCAIAPWFGAPGLGVQYKTEVNVQTLRAAGVLTAK